MIDDGPALREPQPPGAAEPEARGQIDALATFTMNKPAVTVVVKKRRGAAALSANREGAREPRGSQRREDRPPRVYQVPAPTAVSGAMPQATVLEPDNGRVVEPEPNAAAAAAPAPRRRARRDPTHAPGQVTRIVFEPPPRPAAAPAGNEAGHATEGDNDREKGRETDRLAGHEAGRAQRPFAFIERTEVGYEQVMAELQHLGAQIERARRARKFRIA